MRNAAASVDKHGDWAGLCGCAVCGVRCAVRVSDGRNAKGRRRERFTLSARSVDQVALEPSRAKAKGHVIVFTPG
jgi:hypothetical protein